MEVNFSFTYLYDKDLKLKIIYFIKSNDMNMG